MTETKDVNQFTLAAHQLRKMRKETFPQKRRRGGRGKKKKKSDGYKRTHGAEIKMFHIEQCEMNWAVPEERRRKINGHLTEVKGTASRMGFASGAQQLPNNLEQKNYNHTDEK